MVNPLTESLSVNLLDHAVSFALIMEKHFIPISFAVQPENLVLFNFIANRLKVSYHTGRSFHRFLENKTLRTQ